MSSEPSKPITGLRFSIGLSLFYAVFFVIGYLAIVAAADYLIRDAITDNEREIIRERLSEYEAWFRTGQTRMLETRFKEQSLRSDDLVFVYLSGPEANAIMYSSPKGQELIDPSRLEALSSPDRFLVATLTTKDPRNVWTIASTPLPGGHRLQSGRISTTAFEPADIFRRVFFWAIIPVTLLALIGGAFLSYQAMKPVRDLAVTAGEIVETGELDRRVMIEKWRRGDLAHMAILFNRMLDRNQELIRSMRESLDNTAHDLRTPMARLRATAETALAQPESAEAAHDALADCLEESERVLTMLNTLMDIAEAESGVMKLERESVDLAELANQVIDLYELVAEEKQIRIATELPDSLPVEGDRTRLQQVVANLIDNAIKYGKDGGTVRIRGEQAGSDVSGRPFAVLRIADDGIGIKENDLGRIWDRLYRSDRSRSQRGLGLGLSVVKAIVDAHGGEVSVSSQPGTGSEFTVRLPRPPINLASTQ